MIHGANLLPPPFPPHPSPLPPKGKHKITGIILSGGPNSVYEEGAPHVSQGVWDLIKSRSIPVLGICYGMQELAHVFGGRVAPGQEREYGKATVKSHSVDGAMTLFEGLPEEFVMWMSHGDKLHAVPDGFTKCGSTANAEFVAIQNLEKRMWGLQVRMMAGAKRQQKHYIAFLHTLPTFHSSLRSSHSQFHPEVTHSPMGPVILSNFVVKVCESPTDWVMTDYAEEFIENVRKQVGPDGHVIGAVSGGVDSTVAAVLMNRAIGERFHAVLVDNGCLRKDEAKKVLKRLREDCGINLSCVDAGDLFLGKLKGVTEPERKRKIIGGTFIDIFQQEANKIIENEGKVRAGGAKRQDIAYQNYSARRYAPHPRTYRPPT